MFASTLTWLALPVLVHAKLGKAALLRKHNDVRFIRAHARVRGHFKQKGLHGKERKGKEREGKRKEWHA